MELALISGIAYIGYYLSKKGKAPRNPVKLRESVPLNEDVYVNKRLKDVVKTEQALADERFAKAKDPYNQNVIIGSFLSPKVIVDQTQTILPLRETQESILQKYKQNEIGNVISDNKLQNSSPDIERFSISPSLTGPTGFTGITGISGESQNFSHNNMVPFYGGNLKGNSIPERSLIVEQHTGVQNRWRQPKREVERFTPLYKEQVNGNVPFQDIVSRDRYIQSNKKQGVLPFPQERTHYIEPEYVRPEYKSVDDLRVQQKSAVEYKGRIINGQKEIQRARDIENFTRNGSDITSDKNILIPTYTLNKETAPRVYRSKNKSESVDAEDSRDVNKESYMIEGTRNFNDVIKAQSLPLNQDARNTIKQTTHSKYIGGVGASDKNSSMSRDGKFIMKEKNAESIQYDGVSRSNFNSIAKQQVSRKQYKDRTEKTDKECLLENRVPGGGTEKGRDSSTIKFSRFGNREDKTYSIIQGNRLIQPDYAGIGDETRDNHVETIEDVSSQRIADASLILKQLDTNEFNQR